MRGRESARARARPRVCVDNRCFSLALTYSHQRTYASHTPCTFKRATCLCLCAYLSAQLALSLRLSQILSVPVSVSVSPPFPVFPLSPSFPLCCLPVCLCLSVCPCIPAPLPHHPRAVILLIKDGVPPALRIVGRRVRPARVRARASARADECVRASTFSCHSEIREVPDRRIGGHGQSSSE